MGNVIRIDGKPWRPEDDEPKFRFWLAWKLAQLINWILIGSGVYIEFKVVEYGDDRFKDDHGL